MGIGSKRLRQGIGVLACGVAFGGAGRARGGPGTSKARSLLARRRTRRSALTLRPVRGPRPRRRRPSAPRPTLGASRRPRSRRLPRSPRRRPLAGPCTPRAVRPARAGRRRRLAPAPRGDARPLRSLASWASRGELLATSAATPSSGTSFLLLFVGLGLVLLTIGETTFLRRAARASKPTRGTDERLAIHRVQLRR